MSVRTDGPCLMADLTDDILSHMPKLRRVVRSMSRWEDVDDIMQQTFLSAWVAQDKFEVGTNLGGWLYRIMRNECAAHWRKLYREIAHDGDLDDMVIGVDGNQESRVYCDDVLTAIGRLVPEQSVALMMVGVREMAYEAAALRVDVPEATMKTRVRRGRAALGRMMELA